MRSWRFKAHADQSLMLQVHSQLNILSALLSMRFIVLKVHKIEIFFGLDFEICIISLLIMSKY